MSVKLYIRYREIAHIQNENCPLLPFIQSMKAVESEALAEQNGYLQAMRGARSAF
jgi:hypothetical protein